MSNIHIHLHLPDADSTEKVVPLLEKFIDDAGRVTEASIDRALEKNAGPFSEPKGPAEKASEKPKKAAKSEAKKEDPEPEKPAPAKAQPTATRAEAKQLFVEVRQAGLRDNIKEILDTLGASSLSALPDERLDEFVEAMQFLLKEGGSSAAD